MAYCQGDSGRLFGTHQTQPSRRRDQKRPLPMADGAVIERAHWASDLSGEEQPPFQGWFRPVTGSDGRVLYYAGIAEPIGWTDLAP